MSQKNLCPDIEQLCEHVLAMDRRFGAVAHSFAELRCSIPLPLVSETQRFEEKWKSLRNVSLGLPPALCHRYMFNASVFIRILARPSHMPGMSWTSRKSWWAVGVDSARRTHLTPFKILADDWSRISYSSQNLLNLPRQYPQWFVTIEQWVI